MQPVQPPGQAIRARNARPILHTTARPNRLRHASDHLNSHHQSHPEPQRPTNQGLIDTLRRGLDRRVAAGSDCCTPTRRRCSQGVGKVRYMRLDLR
jgi:hypothetical protein